MQIYDLIGIFVVKKTIISAKWRFFLLSGAIIAVLCNLEYLWA